MSGVNVTGLRRDLDIRPARADEASALSALALRAKAHWGYDRAFLDACRDELTATAADIEAGGFWVAQADGRVLGFYRLLRLSRTDLELDALFVEPDHIGRGCGRALLEHVRVVAARGDGIERLLIQADPHAAGFYEAAGALKIGTRESASIPGRRLPLYAMVIGR